MKVNDPNSEVGREAQQKGHFIPNTTWLDFFDEDAAAFYQDNFTRRLIRPYGIDAWWLDATEPEAGWYDFVTGERYEGGQYIEIPVTIESIPVFAKGGSIIPLAAELQHSGELQSITADGVSCAYENGQYRTVTIRWDERRQKLECLSL